MTEITWDDARVAKTLRKSTMLLDLNNNKTDEEIWTNFNNLINENIISDYMSEICSVLSEPNFPMRLSLVTDYLPTIYNKRKQELSVFAIIICINHNEPQKALEYIETYKTEYGTDRRILIEELNYYTSFDSQNIEKISSIIEEINSFREI